MVIGREFPLDRCLLWMDRRRYALFAVLLAVYAAGFNGQWRVGPDTANYATIARNVAEGNGYTHPQGFEQHVHPGLIYLMAACFKLAGSDTFWPAVLVIELIGLATLVVIYRVFSLHAGRPVGVLITLMVGLAHRFFILSMELLNDVPFLFGLMVLLGGYERLTQQRGKTAVNCAIMVFGLACTAAFRIVFLNVAAALLIMAAWRAWRSPHRRRYVVLGLAAVLVLVVFRLLDPRLESTGQLLPREQLIVDQLWTRLAETLTRTLPHNAYLLFEDVATYGMFGNNLGPVVSSVATLAVLGTAVMMARRRPLWGLLVALFVLQWLLFLPGDRYVLAILPLLAFAWWRMAEWLTRRVRGVHGQRLALVLLAVWIGMNAGRVAGDVADQRARPFLEHHAEGFYANADAFGRLVRDAVKENEVVLTPRKLGAPLMFWSRRSCTPVTHAVAGELKAAAYVVAPLDDKSAAMLAEYGFSVGQTVALTKRAPPLAPLRLCKLVRAPAEASTQPDLSDHLATR